MNKFFGCLSVAAIASAAFVACDDSSSSPSGDDLSSSSAEVKNEVYSKDDLEECVKANDGDTVFVQDEKVNYVCQEGEWIAEAKSSSSEKVSSSSEKDESRARL